MKKKAVAKTKDNNTEVVELSNSRSWVDFVKNESYMLFPSNDDWRNKLKYSLIIWGLKEESLEIMQFCMEFKFAYRTIKEWVDKYPDLCEVYDEVKLMLACRRRLGALKKVFDKEVVYKDMHKYDPEYLEINKYHAALRKIEDELNDKLKVIWIDKTESTGLVPKRKVDYDTVSDEVV